MGVPDCLRGYRTVTVLVAAPGFTQLGEGFCGAVGAGVQRCLF